MSRVRNFYRRYARKPVGSNGPTHSKRQASAFFDFSGEHSFFACKEPEDAMNPKCANEKADKVDKQRKERSGSMASSDHAVNGHSLKTDSTLPDAAHDIFEPRAANKIDKDILQHRQLSLLKHKPEKEENNSAKASEAQTKAELVVKGKDPASAKSDTFKSDDLIKDKQ